jgi:hypothetical protein
MFAFAIWDDVEKTLFIARDRFGIKPLYLASVAGAVAAASEIKQLHDLPGIPRRMNLARVYDFLATGISDHTAETMFLGITQLRGGEFVKIDATAVVVIPTFVKIIDQLGGVDLTIRRTILDVTYRTNMDGARLPAGNWHMSGECALAYARIRKAPGTDDMTRGPRQIEILLAARDELARSGNFVSNALSLLDVIGDGVRTDLNPALIPVLAEAAGSFDTTKIVRAVIEPGDTILRYRHKGEYSPFGSVVFFNPDRMLMLGARLFPTAGTRPWGFPATKSEPKLGAEASFVPVPLASGASPTPSPTASPTAAHPYPTLATCDAGLPLPRHTATPDPTSAPETSEPPPTPSATATP